MKSKRLASSRFPVNKVGVVDLDDGKSREEFASGDVVWIPLRNLWWPTQVVDENMVSESIKPYKKLKCEKLLRLYGTYHYLYRDPAKHRSEFEKVLKQNNGNYSEVLQKTLEQDLHHLRSSCSKKGVSDTTGKSDVATPKEEDKKQGGIKKKNKIETSKSATPKKESIPKKDMAMSPGSGKPRLGENSELSARRVRVMKSLGLAAPCGSPFLKNGV